MGSALAILVAAYLAMGGLMYAFQERLLFLPNMPGRDFRATPAAVGLAFEEIHLRTADGETLHAWYMPAPEARHVLVHFHGNAGNMGDRVELARLWHRMGVDVLLFDYRGYGNSSGRPTEQGTYEDAATVWAYLTQERGLSPQRILLHGQSLGGGVAAWLAVEEKPAALMLESTFTSVPELAQQLYPWLPARRLARIHYDTRARLAHIDCPVLVIHSPDDDIIPYSHGRALYDAAREPRQFLELRGDHNAGVYLSAEQYVTGLRSFLDGLDAAAGS